MRRGYGPLWGRNSSYNREATENKSPSPPVLRLRAAGTVAASSAGMDVIDLRWEWRTFGDTFGGADARVLSGAPQRQDDAELHIVSDHSDACMTIRGDRLEVKTLRQVDARGLELWQPALTSTFPLGAAPLEAVYHAWAITPPASGHASWTLATFLDDVLQKDHSLTLVNVTTSRRSTTIDGCAVEIADLTFDGVPTRTMS